MDNELTPKFLNFKLYRKDLRNTRQVKTFQKKLLNNELTSYIAIINSYLLIVSLLDFSHFLNFIRNVNDNKIKKIKIVQNHKLFSLGLEHEII